MESLIKAYLIHTTRLPADLIVMRVNPIIRNDQQHYEVMYDDECSWNGRDVLTVSVSELLTFLYERTLL